MSDLGEWWFSAMPFFRQLGDNNRNLVADCTIRRYRQSVHLLHLARGLEGNFSLGVLSEALTDLSLGKHPVTRIELILQDRHLERPLALFRISRSRCLDIARLDIHSSTPLDLQNTLILLPRYTSDELAARYFVVRRNVLGPIIEAIDDASCHLVAIKLQTDDGLIEIDPEDYRHLRSDETKRATVRKIAAAAMVAVFVGLAATFAHIHLRYSHACAELDTHIAAVEIDAKTVRALISKRKSQLQKLAAVREQKQQTKSVAVLWEEVSRVLSDTAWASDFSVKGQQVRLNGFSKSASGLIAQLDASPMFASPTFTAPVVKSPEVDAERFSISMELQR